MCSIFITSATNSDLCNSSLTHVDKKYYTKEVDGWAARKGFFCAKRSWKNEYQVSKVLLDRVTHVIEENAENQNEYITLLKDDL